MFLKCFSLEHWSILPSYRKEVWTISIIPIRHLEYGNTNFQTCKHLLGKIEVVFQLLHIAHINSQQQKLFIIYVKKIIQSKGKFAWKYIHLMNYIYFLVTLIDNFKVLSTSIWKNNLKHGYLLWAIKQRYPLILILSWRNFIYTSLSFFKNTWSNKEHCNTIFYRLEMTILLYFRSRSIFRLWICYDASSLACFRNT